MLIRGRQTKAISELMLQRYLVRVVPFIEEEYPEVALRWSQTELQRAIRLLVQEADQYGLKACNTVTRFIVWRFDYGVGFPSRSDWAWVTRILSRTDLGEEEKIARIDKVLVGGPLWPQDHPELNRI